MGKRVLLEAEDWLWEGEVFNEKFQRSASDNIGYAEKSGLDKSAGIHDKPTPNVLRDI